MKLTHVLAVAALALAPLAHAQHDSMKGMDMKDTDMKMDKGAKKAEVKTHHGSGVVKSVDAAKGTVTIAHGPVETLKWSAMTMTFKAKDKKLLDSLKPGQKVEFEFIQEGKTYIVTRVK